MRKIPIKILIYSIILIFTAGLGGESDDITKKNDWALLWQCRVEPIPSATKTKVGQAGELLKDLGNQEWLRLSTKYHQIYFQESTDPNKIRELYYLIDNIYEFLAGRSPAKPATPIRAFIMPNQRGRSRCSMTANDMRTGDKGDTIFITTSLLHEETHLFNFAFLKGKAQGWWAGEFFCIYFQTRAAIEAKGKNVKKELAAKLPNGPRYHLTQLATAGKAGFDEAVAVLFFFEEKYGVQQLNQFRRACLETSKASNGKALHDDVFKQAFGKDVKDLEKEWLDFFGWEGVLPFPSGTSDETLQVKVTYSAEKASVQEIMQSLSQMGGLRYNREKSFSQTDPLCRNFIKNVKIENKPLWQAFEEILRPSGLTYKNEKGSIVLYKR